VVIQTSTYEVGWALLTVMVLGPGFIGAGCVIAVVSSNDAGVADWADRSWMNVPVLLRSSDTDASVVGCGNCRISPTPFLKPGNGTGSL
jgi:hypothetical protein